MSGRRSGTCRVPGIPSMCSLLAAARTCVLRRSSCCGTRSYLHVVPGGIDHLSVPDVDAHVVDGVVEEHHIPGPELASGDVGAVAVLHRGWSGAGICPPCRSSTAPARSSRSRGGWRRPIRTERPYSSWPRLMTRPGREARKALRARASAASLAWRAASSFFSWAIDFSCPRGPSSASEAGRGPSAWRPPPVRCTPAAP